MGLLLALLIAYPDSARFVVRTEFCEALGYATRRCSARDSAGTLHLVYSYTDANGPGQVSDIYYVFSTDNGFTWSDTLNLSETGRPRSVCPALAIDRRGRLHCAWQENEVEYQYVEIFYRCRDSTGWGPAERVSYQRNRGQRHFPSLACDSLNRVHLVWDACPSQVELAEVWYSIRDDSGWTAPENLTQSSADDCAPLIAVNRFDDFLLSWSECAGRYRVVCRFKRDGQWLPKQVLDTTWETGVASTAADAYGRFHAVWARGYERRTDTLALLYYARYDTAWSQMVRCSDSVHGRGSIAPGSMTVDSTGNVYVVWPREFPLPGQGDVQSDILYRTFNGREWSSIVNLTSDSVFSYCPHLGHPVTGAGVDLFWTSTVPNSPWPHLWDVMFMQLSPVAPGIAERPPAGSLRPGVRVRPGIAAGRLHLEGSGPVAVYDLSGRRLSDLVPGANDVRHLAPGVYFLRREGEKQTQKVVLQR